MTATGNEAAPGTAPGTTPGTTKAPRHRNGFDLLRLVAASSVIVGHAFPVVGLPSVYIAGVGLQAIGVMVFFAISGFLITNSWARDPHLGRFWAKRALRIMPGLAVVVLATALVIGPVVSTEDPGAYLASPLTWTYIARNLALWTTHGLPGVFADSPYPHSVNTSLWTLPIEVLLYASTLVAVPCYVRFGRVATLAVGGIALASALLWDLHPYRLTPLFDQQLYGFRVFDALGYLPNYLMGSVFAAMRWDAIAAPRARRAAILSIAALIVLSLVPHPVPLTLLLLPLTAATLFIGLGRRLDLAILHRLGDISYGTYLWGFLIQQLTVWLTGAAGGPWGNIALSLPLAWLFGLASWRWIEKPMLRLAPRQPAPAKTSAASANL